MTKKENFDFDVALSFAGEDRELVREIRDVLRRRGISIFYDEDHVADMWGEDLGDFLDAIYRKRARYAVVFISRHYAEKAWPSHERKSALARAIESKMPYVLPIRLDDTEAPGIRPTTEYIDARKVGLLGIVDAIQQKVNQNPIGSRLSSTTAVPRTAIDLELLLAERPLGWEYFLYAGSLLVELDRLEHKYRDHELRYAASTSRTLGWDEVMPYLNGMLAEISRIVGQTHSVLGEDVQERAFGKPGEPGDADLIQHSAKRLISIYEDILEWSAHLRGTAVPDEFRPVFDLAARFADNPVREFREFVAHVVTEMDKLPEHLARPEPREPLAINLQLVLTIDDEVVEAFGEHLRALEARL